MHGISAGGERTADTKTVTAVLNARLQPLDRGDIYEDPLHDALRAAGLGEVTGGGSLFSPNDGVSSCDIEIAILDPTPENLSAITATLERLGAPRGSRLVVDGSDVTIPFGKSEGIAVYLNGVDLDDDIYEACDVNHVIAEFDRLMDGAGRFHSHWRGESETALYLYGACAETMHQRIQPFIDSYPLCQKARVLQIA